MLSKPSLTDAVKVLETTITEAKRSQEQAERELVRIRTSIEALGNEEKTLRESVTTLNTQLAALRDLLLTLTEQRDTLYQQQTEVKESLAASKQVLASVEDLVNRGRESVDAEIERYRDDQSRALEATQAEIAQTMLQLDESRKAVVDAEAELSTVNNEFIEQQRMLANFKDAADRSKIVLTEEIASLEQERDQLQLHISNATTEYNEVLAATESARRKYEEFADYERRALVALDAKDKSLQERDDNLKHAEILARNRGSFLPKA